MRWVAVSILAVAISGVARAGDVSLESVWTLSGLDAPESVALAPGGTTLFVSNVNGEGGAVDGNGYIALVSTDGKVVKKAWASGLNAPKGLIVKGDRLFVSDVTRLVEINAKTGAIVATHDIPGAKFLNDTALAPDGRVLISDSDAGRIYAFDGRSASTLVEDAKLGAVNGMLVEKARLVIVTMKGQFLAMDWKTKALSVLGTGFGDGDGLASLGDGRYLVSEWPGQLWLVDAKGAKTTLIDSRAQETYINDFVLAGDRLYVPHWKPGSLSLYRVKR